MNYYQEREPQILKNFEGHEAKYACLRHQNSTPVERLVWGKPGSSVYRQNYICNDNFLYVSGDMGDAVYQWSQVVTLRWISGLSLDYFASKCQGSEDGRGYRRWDSDKARDYLDWLIQMRHEEYEDGEAFEKKVRESGAYDNISTQQEWHFWMQDGGYKTFGDDYYEYVDIGEVISLRCQSHLLGLKKAIEMLLPEAEYHGLL